MVEQKIINIKGKNKADNKTPGQGLLQIGLVYLGKISESELNMHFQQAQNPAMEEGNRIL